MGTYGGPDNEGVFTEDTYEPKRFFSFYPDTEILQIVSKIFDLVYFNKLELEYDKPIHFQSMILKRKTEQCNE